MRHFRLQAFRETDEFCRAERKWTTFPHLSLFIGIFHPLTMPGQIHIINVDILHLLRPFPAIRRPHLFNF